MESSERERIVSIKCEGIPIRNIRCDRVLPYTHDNFEHNGYTLRRVCRKCRTESRREYINKYRKSEQGKKIIRNNRLVTRYGITEEEYNSMLQRQNNVCFICKNKEKTTRCDKQNLSVDHDHKTGEVRSLLCNRCNTIVGRFEEDSTISLEELIQNYRDYLIARNWRDAKEAG